MSQNCFKIPKNRIKTLLQATLPIQCVTVLIERKRAFNAPSFIPIPKSTDYITNSTQQGRKNRKKKQVVSRLHIM